jgi:hypothetical protein
MVATTIETPSGDKVDQSVIAAHWTDITAYLAPPGIVWEWNESELSHHLKCKLKARDRICSAPDGKRWETSERLWLHVISVAADYETIGAFASGQQIFIDVPCKTSSSFTFKEQKTSTQFKSTEQKTLSGGIADGESA